jgi:hypothetical protein
MMIAGEFGDARYHYDRAVERLRGMLEQHGYRVIRTFSPEDGLACFERDASYGVTLLASDLPHSKYIDENVVRKIIRVARPRILSLPIFLVVGPLIRRVPTVA